MRTLDVDTVILRIYAVILILVGIFVVIGIWWLAHHPT